MSLFLQFTQQDLLYHLVLLLNPCAVHFCGLVGWLNFGLEKNFRGMPMSIMWMDWKQPWHIDKGVKCVRKQKIILGCGLAKILGGPLCIGPIHFHKILGVPWHPTPPPPWASHGSINSRTEVARKSVLPCQNWDMLSVLVISRKSEGVA